MVSYVNWISWDQVIFNLILTLQDGEEDESDNIEENDKITDDEDDEEWKIVTTCMLNSVNNMNWNILVDYITKIIFSYGSFDLLLYLDPPPHSQTRFLHMCF